MISSPLRALALVALCIFTGVARAQEPVYTSHFEENLQRLLDWKATPPEVGAEAVVVRALEPGDGAGEHRAALVIRTDALSEPLRLAQIKDLFALEPGVEYELRVTCRAPEVRLEPGGRVRFVVTDARWSWSSPSLSLAAPEGEWRTLVLPFTAPEGGGHYRVRFEVLKASLELEVAEISIVPTARP